MQETDLFYMGIAISLAKKGLGRTRPNPPVGSVIVKNGRIVGEGYHKKSGNMHAEASAISSADSALDGATLYTTLEPCSHHGRTPPCSEAIIKSGIKKVVVGTIDPNPSENGAGLEKLMKAGIDVQVGVMENECKNLIEMYSKYITTGIPFIALKWAMSVDGKIATKTGDSRWISGDSAIEFVHHLRNIYDAVAVGIGTVFTDNPSLTCRIDGGRNPIRIIFDSHARTPVSSDIVKTAKDVRTILIHTDSASCNKLKQLNNYGVKTILAEKEDKRIDIIDLLRNIGSLEITSLLVEGGGNLIGSFIEKEQFDKVYIVISPKIIGGKGALTPVENQGVKKVKDAIRLDRISYLFKGDDIILVGYKSD
ncbi:MAG: bifunctional diaminohydroxyphosphoribosylaminopyrimidine deaminase/5-amino-6-(5-phosphoribosylamino)uracil reductase RibD [bacterium]